MDFPAPEAPAEPMRLISLDDGWAVLAVDEHATGSSAAPDLHVYAVDTEHYGIASLDDLRALEQRESAIPVRPFLLSELPPKHQEACAQSFGLSLPVGGF